MTRDEIVRELQTTLAPHDLALTLCHEGFDAFVDLLSDDRYGPFVDLAPSMTRDRARLLTAWFFFRKGWEAR